MLWRVDPKKEALFFQEQRQYEVEVGERQKEVPGMSVASCEVSFDRLLLENMHAIGGTDDVA